MNKFYLMIRLLICLFIFLVNFSPSYAQPVDFVRIPPLVDAHIRADIPGLEFGDIAAGDINGDGSLDLIFTGRLNAYSYSASIHLNDGQGTFIEQSQSCIRSGYKSRCFLKDLDADGDLDLFITGLEGFGLNLNAFADIYHNNGQGKFRRDTSFVLPPFFEAVTAVGDVNGDSLPDIFITGKPSPNSVVSMKAFLLFNSLQGGFSVDSSLSIAPVYDGEALFIDIDNDNDLDLITTGATSSQNNASLYKNNGSGTFTNANSQLIGVKESSISAGDVNGDGFKDLLITGEQSFFSGGSFLYINQNGTLVLDTTEVVTYTRGTGAFLDYNGDGHLDIYISENSSNDELASFYSNDGLGHFTLDVSQIVKETEYAAVAAFDADQDGDVDLAISGRYDPGFNSSKISLVYENDSGIFKKSDGVQFAGTYKGDAELADVDNDGDLDLLTTGNGLPGSWFTATRLFLNDGQGHLTENTNHTLAVSEDKFTFAHLNGDTLIDLLLCGQSGAEVYLNSINNGLAFSSNLLPSGARDGDVTSGDLDGDGDIDLVISRKSNPQASNNNPLTTVLFNNGSGVFTEQVGGNIHAVESTALELFDADNDGDLDLFQLGYDSHLNYAELFLNNGNGNFSLSTSSFRGLTDGAITHGDIDADGDIDLIYIGDSTGATHGGKTYVYLNQGNGSFTLKPNTGLPDIERGDVALCDIDQDGDLDLYLMGTTRSPYPLNPGLYLNDGLGNFNPLMQTELEPFGVHDAIFGDMNNDGIPDLVIHGSSEENQDLYGLVLENQNCSTVTNVSTVRTCNSYVWPETFCTYNSSGTYYSVRKNPNGCDHVEQLDLIIDTAFSTISITDNVLEGPNGYLSYQWLRCDSSGLSILPNEINQTFVPTVSGSYALVVSTNLCSDTSACISLNDVHLQELISSVNIYPNPSDRYIYIDNMPFSGKYTITNSIGSVVGSGDLNKGNNTLLLSIFPPGYYILTLFDSKKNKSVRFSIVRN